MKSMLTLAIVLFAAAAVNASATDGMKTGTPAIKSISALAFGPEGVLFVGDPDSATIFAIATKDTTPSSKEDIKVTNVTETVGSMLGVPAAQLKINDIKVNPASGNLFLAVTRGKSPAILKVARDGKISEFATKDVMFSSVTLPNPTKSKNVTEAITSMGFVANKLVVSGLSNEQFSSTLRSIAFPFKDADKGSSVEIFHGAHGRYETNAPIRTFVAYKVADKEEIVAAYTCTPLVRIPVSDLQPGAKVKGKTIAELGNMNRPLDMVVYSKEGKDFILMANSARGVMKIPAAEFAGAKAITERPKGATDGVTYETIKGLKGVEHLDKLDDNRAVMLVKTETGSFNLITVPMP